MTSSVSRARLSSTDSGKLRISTFGFWSSWRNAAALRAMYSDVISWLVAWHATSTMACRSSGSEAQASRLMMHSSVGPGSCQPG